MGANKMWGGRFAGEPAKIMEDITPSIDFDKRLAEQDLAGSRAHARMLAVQGIISKDDADAILKGLDAVGKEIAEGKVTFQRTLEDIHLNIEARLAEIAGPAAGRLHTARSRNDQVVTDFRQWLRQACTRADEGLRALQGALLAQASRTHNLKSVATWSLRERAVCSRPAAGPISSVRRASILRWMSSRAREKAKVPASISRRIVSRPITIFSASSAAMMPFCASMRAWA